ncbi:MAG TPA: hypothetical protein VFG32_10600, partial [Bacteroidota bacterium]|nr:hypothetical protein [Bacteroidota bacterium]
MVRSCRVGRISRDTIRAKKPLSSGYILVLLLTLFPSSSSAQTGAHPNSPVFRDYKTTRPAPLIEQSDVTYQLWQVFMLERKANAGDVLAQHELGIRYLLGRGVGADT